MTRFELIGRIVNHLQSLNDSALHSLLAQLEGNITDDTLDVITYGADDTEHLISSPDNIEDLYDALDELGDYDLLMPKSKNAA